MRKTKLTFYGIFTLLLIFVSIDHWEEIKLEKKYFLKDAAKSALDLNKSPSTEVFEFDNPKYGTIQLNIGEKDTYGFRHILALHTSRYLPYEKKSSEKFDENVNGKEIIRGINNMYKHSIKYYKANFFKHPYNVFIGATKIDDNYNTYVLVVKSYSKEILTFFPVENLDSFEIQREIAKDLSNVYSFPKAFSIDQDLGTYVENKSVPEDELLDSIYNPKYGWVKLYVGNNYYGFRHILKRHTLNYFSDYYNKNNATLFNKYVSGTEIWKAIREVYQNAALVELYNSAFNRNEVYIGIAQIGGKYERCLLVVRKTDKHIITFYPLSLQREQKLREEYTISTTRYYWD